MKIPQNEFRHKIEENNPPSTNQTVQRLGAIFGLVPIRQFLENMLRPRSMDMKKCGSETKFTKLFSAHVRLAASV